MSPEAKAAFDDIAETILRYIPQTEIDHLALRYLDDPDGLAAMLAALREQVGKLESPPSEYAITAGVIVLAKMIRDRAAQLGQGGHA